MLFVKISLWRWKGNLYSTLNSLSSQYGCWDFRVFDGMNAVFALLWFVSLRLQVSCDFLSCTFLVLVLCYPCRWCLCKETQVLICVCAEFLFSWRTFLERISEVFLPCFKLLSKEWCFLLWGKEMKKTIKSVRGVLDFLPTITAY